MKILGNGATYRYVVEDTFNDGTRIYSAGGNNHWYAPDSRYRMWFENSGRWVWTPNNSVCYSTSGRLDDMEVRIRYQSQTLVFTRTISKGWRSKGSIITTEKESYQDIVDWETIYVGDYGMMSVNPSRIPPTYVAQGGT